MVRPCRIDCEFLSWAFLHLHSHVLRCSLSLSLSHEQATKSQFSDHRFDHLFIMIVITTIIRAYHEVKSQQYQRHKHAVIIYARCTLTESNRFIRLHSTVHLHIYVYSILHSHLCDAFAYDLQLGAGIMQYPYAASIQFQLEWVVCVCGCVKFP